MSIPRQETSEGGTPMTDPLETLRQSEHYIVTPYHWPDTDGVSSAIGVAEYLQKAKGIAAQPMISQTPQKETIWVMNELGISLPQIEQIPHGTGVIIVDTSDPEDLPSIVDPTTVVAVIDHRAYHRAEAFPHATVQIEPVGAAATLVTEKFHRQLLVPSSDALKLLYAGIASNTINFNASSTTSRDRAMAQWLQDQGDRISMDIFVQGMFEAKSDFEGESIKKPIEDDLSSRLQEIAGVPSAVAQLEILEVAKLFRQRGEELYEALRQIQQERGAGRIFLSAIDINEGRNYFLFPDESDLGLVASVANLSREEDFIVSDKVITRKELIAALQSR